MESGAFSVEIGLTLGVILITLVLFVWDRWALEVVGLFSMVSLVALGILTPTEGVQGFANEATVTVGLMLGLSAGLVKTGAVDVLGEAIGRLAGDSEWQLLVVILTIVVPVSALLNNTAAVAILLPMVLGLCRRRGVTPSRILMPLSFGSQLGGTLTLIGTSTNLLVAGIALDLGLGRLGVFDITPPALVLTAVGVLYLATVGRWLTPHRESTIESRTSLARREYLSELEVGESSSLLDTPVGATSLPGLPGSRVIGVWRGDRQLQPSESGDRRFEVGDRVVIRSSVREILGAIREEDLTLGAVAPELGEEQIEEPKVVIAEMMVAPRSRIVGASLGALRGRLPAEVSVMALERHGEEVAMPIREVDIEPGDVLLVRAPFDRLQSLHREGDLALLGTIDLPERRTSRLWVSVIILAGVVLLAATGVASILTAALTGMVAMVGTGCVRAEEVYREMDWGVLMLLATLLALGTAMQKTGAADFLASVLIDLLRSAGPHAVLAAMFLLGQLLTAVVTNNATAVVLTPLAVATARSMEVSPLPFVVAVMFAASNCFATPIGYQTNLFVYGPGGYRFTDFLRVGGPLMLIQLLVATWTIPVFMPF